MSEFECPYCGIELDRPNECNEIGRTYEAGCPGCSKNFVFTVDYEIDYFPRQAPCLNGEEHKWEEIPTPEKYGFKRIECKACGKRLRKKKIVQQNAPVEPLKLDGYK